MKREEFLNRLMAQSDVRGMVQCASDELAKYDFQVGSIRDLDEVTVYCPHGSDEWFIAETTLRAINSACQGK